MGERREGGGCGSIFLSTTQEWSGFSPVPRARYACRAGTYIRTNIPGPLSTRQAPARAAHLSGIPLLPAHAHTRATSPLFPSPSTGPRARTRRWEWVTIEGLPPPP